MTIRSAVAEGCRHEPEVRILRSIDALASVREAWDRLADRAATPLLSHAWCLSAARCLHVEADLHIVCVHRDGRLVAAAPLVRHADGTRERLVSIGAVSLHEPGGLLCEDEHALDDLLAALSSLGSPIALPRVPADGALARLAPHRATSRALYVRRVTRPSLGVPIRGTWDDYWRGLSRRITQNLPRVEARARRQFGSVDASVHRPSAAEVDALVDAFIIIEASGWKGRRGSSLRDCDTRQAFFRSYARLAAASGQLRVTTVRFGEALAAMELAVEAHGRVWQLKIGFDDQFAAFYPGLLLTRASIRAAFADGQSSYEFLGSAEAWEERWQPVPRSYHLLLVYPLNARGLAAICGDAAWKIRDRVPVLTWLPAARVPQAADRFA